jgi:CRP/FNR family cyclic AMP-dependent transcriptional regulator
MITQEILEKSNLFGDLKTFQWQELIKITKENQYNEGDVVFSEGDQSTELYMVLDGEVEISIKVAPQLSDSTVFMAKSHDIFGEFAFVDPKPRSASARCMSKSTLAVIRRADFEELIKKFPRIGLNFYRSLVNLLSERLRKMNSYLRDTFIRCSGLEI